MTLRVTLDATAVPSEPRGAGRYVVELARALDRRDDVDVHLLARSDDGVRWAALAPRSEVTAEAPGPRPLRLAWEQLRLPRLLRRIGAACHHAPHYTMPPKSPVPVIVTIHDLTLFDHPEWHERSKVLLFRRAIRTAARRADALICVSESTATRLASLLAPRVPVRVIPHGVDHTLFRSGPVGTDEAALAALEVKPPFIAFVGTLEPRKDVPTLIRAFDRVADRHPDLTLVVAGGRGWGGGAVEAALAVTAHWERIRLTGFVDDATVAALLRNAAAVAYPSLDEGFGLPALEALACGAPLVTTKGTPMAEVTGDAALLVEPGDEHSLAAALEELMTSGSESEGRRARGLLLAARYTWDATAAAHVDAYRSVAEARL